MNRLGGSLVQSVYKNFWKNIDAVDSVILSRASGYQPGGNPVICLTIRIRPWLLVSAVKNW
jgi:hypothetical protein